MPKKTNQEVETMFRPSKGWEQRCLKKKKKSWRDR